MTRVSCTQLNTNALFVLVLPTLTMLPPSEIDKSMAAILRRFSARKSFLDGGTILLPYFDPYSERFWGVWQKSMVPPSKKTTVRRP